MRYDFDIIPERRDTDSLKWRKYDPDVIPMWVADMDFVSPAPVIQALRERVEHGIFGYPDGLGIESQTRPALQQLVVERMAERYHWHIEPADLVFAPGVVTATHLACHAVAGSGGVLVQTPTYPPLLHAAQTIGAINQQAQLRREGDGSYQIDWSSLTSAITPETRLFILCNPHNPVGRVFQPAELERLAEICLRHGVVICSDEIHSDLIYTGQRHTPIASLHPDIARQTITLIAPTKTFNLAGLQCAIAIIQNPELRQTYLQTRRGLVSWINLMGVLAAETAYREGQDWLEQLLVYLEANRDTLCEYVRRELPGITLAQPEATYLAWLDCRQARIEGNPYEFFLHQARVALADGALFGPGGEGFVRLNFGCPRAILIEALKRMQAALTPS
ncbi:MAG TPA: MalY/PatB family protein [Anaerolineae bacterium]|nr:MalY/PatB family protein [Anaerolineae bacterium]